MEQSSKAELVTNKTLFGPASVLIKNYSQSTGAGVEGRQSQSRPEQQLTRLSRYKKIKVIDVFGEEAEPICDYLRCHHKFSMHGLDTRNCQCKHPSNSAVGA
jgi:purine nucleoside permease